MIDIQSKLSRAERKFNRILAALICAVGAALLIAGLMIPPEGEIHSSVLVAAAEIMTFSAALLGINAVYCSLIKELIKNGALQDKSASATRTV